MLSLGLFYMDSIGGFFQELMEPEGNTEEGEKWKNFWQQQKAIFFLFQKKKSFKNHEKLLLNFEMISCGNAQKYA